MTTYIAFLRAINVGGHTVKMNVLCAVFESLGYKNVSSFIASGNIIFATAIKNHEKLKSTIEQKLLQVLGYEVATFIRTIEDCHAIINFSPFDALLVKTAQAYNIGFLSEKPAPQVIKKIMEFTTDIDTFGVNGKELYWLCKKKQSESIFSNNKFEKSTGLKATFRGLNTLEKLATKYPL
jgi:uncharacterized protein (DUF1697 family)